MTIKGTSGDDVLKGTSGKDVFDLSQGGDDTAKGLGGKDIFRFGAALTGADHVNGGDGRDQLSLNGDYSAGLVFSSTTIQHVETIRVAAGHNYDLTLRDGNVAAGRTLTINAAALGAGNHLVFDGSAETDGHFRILAGAGNDVLTGGRQSDTFDLSLGGKDTAHGGAGNDTFHMGAALAAADAVDGGKGNDTLDLNGDYTGANALSFRAATMTNVETVLLEAGHSYSLTTVNATVAAGKALAVDASALGSGNTLVFNASAETDGRFNVTGGAGGDTITLGNRAVLLASTIDGGSGGFDSLVLDGNFATLTLLNNSIISNIDYLFLNAGHSYNFVAADGTVASGDSLQVEGDILGAGDTLTFDASADTQDYYLLYGGAGDDILKGSQAGSAFGLGSGGSDTITGGAGNDVVFAEGGLSSGDIIDGGGGFNYIYAETAVSMNVTFGVNSLTNLQEIQLSQHGSAIPTFTFTMNDGNVAAAATMIIDGQILGASNTLTVNAGAESDGHYTLRGGAANDTLTGGLLGDTLTGNGGNDVFKYTSVAQSASTTHDTITDLDAAHDFFDLTTSVGAVDATVAGDVSTVSFDSDLAARIGTFAGAGDAIVVHATGGTLNTHFFLVVDSNGDSAYTAGSDLVVDITGFTGTLAAGNFI
jgi:Ca2+-binding RTX toxin-like protein